MGFHLPSHSKHRYYFMELFPLIYGLIILFILFQVRHIAFLFLSISIVVGVVLAYVGLHFVIDRTILFRTNYQIKSLCEEERFRKSFELLNSRSKYLSNRLAPNLQATKAMIFLKKGEYDKTENILDDLLQNYPNFQIALYYKACLESRKENIEESLKYLKKNYKIQKRLLVQTKNPISRWILRKKTKNFVSFLKKDEDLKFVRETEEFDRLIRIFKKHIAD